MNEDPVPVTTLSHNKSDHDGSAGAKREIGGPGRCVGLPVKKRHKDAVRFHVLIHQEADHASPSQHRDQPLQSAGRIPDQRFDAVRGAETDHDFLHARIIDRRRHHGQWISHRHGQSQQLPVSDMPLPQ